MKRRLFHDSPGVKVLQDSRRWSWQDSGSGDALIAGDKLGHSAFLKSDRSPIVAGKRGPAVSLFYGGRVRSRLNTLSHQFVTAASIWRDRRRY